MKDFTHSEELNDLYELLESAGSILTPSLLYNLTIEIVKKYPGTITLLLRYPQVLAMHEIVTSIDGMVAGQDMGFSSKAVFDQLLHIEGDRLITLYADIIADNLFKYPQSAVLAGTLAVASNEKISAAIQEVFKSHPELKEVHDDLINKLDIPDPDPTDVPPPPPVPAPPIH